MEKTTAGGEQSNFAAAACLINVDGLYKNACAGLYRCSVVVIRVESARDRGQHWESS